MDIPTYTGCKKRVDFRQLKPNQEIIDYGKYSFDSYFDHYRPIIDDTKYRGGEYVSDLLRKRNVLPSE